MEAIVLAGGFGTRLRHIISDVPKPMSSVCGKPFLVYLLEYLKANGIMRVIIAVGYMSNIIRSYFGDAFGDIQIIYSEENKPLFTGGAIKQALTLCSEENVFVINGDTYFDVPLQKMNALFDKKHAQLSIAVKPMQNFDRYGTVSFDSSSIITGFEEKQYKESGFINGGIYLIRKDLLDEYPAVFSFEREVMEIRVAELNMTAFICDGYFIDIGIPEDYFKAQDNFAKLKGSHE